MNRQIQLRLVTFLAVFVLSDIAAQEDMPAEPSAVVYSKSAAGRGKSFYLINCQGKKEFWTNQYPPSMPRHFAPGALAYYK